MVSALYLRGSGFEPHQQRGGGVGKAFNPECLFCPPHGLESDTSNVVITCFTSS